MFLWLCIPSLSLQCVSASILYFSSALARSYVPALLQGKWRAAHFQKLFFFSSLPAFFLPPSVSTATADGLGWRFSDMMGVSLGCTQGSCTLWSINRQTIVGYIYIHYIYIYYIYIYIWIYLYEFYIYIHTYIHTYVHIKFLLFFIITFSNSILMDLLFLLLSRTLCFCCSSAAGRSSGAGAIIWMK